MSIADNMNIEWLFCPSDVFHLQSNFNHLTMFRIHPFPEKKIPLFIVSEKNSNNIIGMENDNSKEKQKTMEDMIEIDPKTNIFYLHIGKASTNLVIKTPVYKWPKKYTFMLWVEWEPNLIMVTTFDSWSNAPIIGKSYTNMNSLGCASESGRGYLSDRLVLKEWQFVVAVGGKTDDESTETSRKTNLFVGDLSNKPKFVGSMTMDICGYETYSIGHQKGTQGPGKVAYMKVYDDHLSEEQILQEYFQSMSNIMIQWTKNEYYDVLVVLKEYCANVDDIVNIVVEYCCGSWFLSNINTQ